MFRLFSYKNFFSVIGKTLILVCFLFVMLQTPVLNAQSLIEEAKKEGTLTLYSGLTLADTKVVGDAFMEKYPFIKFKFIRIPSSKRLQRLITEKHGRIKVADVYQAVGVWTNVLKKEGLTQKYISPQAKDWPEGFIDPEGNWTAYYSSYNAWSYNTRLVSAAEAPKRLEDLLDPKWKGRMGMSSNEYEWYQGVLDFMGREKGLQFMKRLAEQEITFMSGKTLIMQLMASGEFAIAKGALHRALQMKKKGAPVQLIDFPTPTFAGMRYLVLHADAPHPNAGKLFIDFMLSKEGQNVLNTLDRHPIRIDIEVDPAIDKVRRNLFPIRATSAEQETALMQEFNEIFSIR